MAEWISASTMLRRSDSRSSSVNAGQRRSSNSPPPPTEGKIIKVNGNSSDNEAVAKAADPESGLRPGSVRRTSSLQSLWSLGNEQIVTIVGRARDVKQPPDQQAANVAEDHLEARLGLDGRLVSLGGSRCQLQLGGFAGLKPGGEMRKAMSSVLSDEAMNATCLHRLLDDLAGAAFMAFAAWHGWEGGLNSHVERTGMPSPADRDVTDVCISYAPGSPSIRADGRGREDIARQPEGPPAAAFTDTQAFHALTKHDGPDEWRLRRTDVWRDGNALFVDAWFQDSCAIFGNPDKRRIFHEYGLLAKVDAEALTLESVDVTPHVLPYLTCEAAPATAAMLLGHHVAELRKQVPAQLRGPSGCTHLNDMLRSLLDVVSLARQVRGRIS